MTWQKSLANPAPLGLIAFAYTVTLASMRNALIIGRDDSLGLILGMAFFLGGVVQVIVGIMEYVRGNAFGTATFGAFGAFWLSWAFAIMWFIDRPLFVSGHGAWAGFFFPWFLLTLLLVFTIPWGDFALQITFLLLAITLFLLFLGNLIYTGSFTGGEIVIRMAGWMGLVTSAGAAYVAFATLNGWPTRV